MELEAEGRTFFVHRVLLAAQSPIFASMFQARLLPSLSVVSLANVTLSEIVSNNQLA